MIQGGFVKENWVDFTNTMPACAAEGGTLASNRSGEEYIALFQLEALSAS